MTGGEVFIDKLSADLSTSLASGRTGSGTSLVMPASMMVDMCGNILVATLANSSAQSNMPLKNTKVSLTVFQQGAPITCPPRTVTHAILVEQFPSVKLSSDTIVCTLSDSMLLEARTTPAGQQYTYRWQAEGAAFGALTGSAVLFHAQPGIYNIITTASTSAGCSGTDTMQITVLPPFRFRYLTPDTLIHLGDSFQLYSESDAVTWKWTPPAYLSSDTIPNPISRPIDAVVYTLTGTDQHGCSGSADVRVALFYESSAAFPSAFSPNGDGLNDRFRIQNRFFDNLIALQIFNRYGQLLFETSDPDAGWDGTHNGMPAPAGTYFYQALVELPLAGGRKSFRGDVTLIR